MTTLSMEQVGAAVAKSKEIATDLAQHDYATATTILQFAVCFMLLCKNAGNMEVARENLNAVMSTFPLVLLSAYLERKS